jgi:hypothetical protein
MLLAAEPRAPDPVPDGAERSKTEACASGSRSSAGFCAHGGPRQGGQRRHDLGARGRDAGHRGRKRLGQDDAGAGDHAADLVRGAGSPSWAATSRGWSTRELRPCARHADRVPGPLRLAQPAHDRCAEIIAEGLGVHGIDRRATRAARRWWPRSWPRSGSTRRRWTATRTSSPAASASASPSRAR